MAAAEEGRPLSSDSETPPQGARAEAPEPLVDTAPLGDAPGIPAEGRLRVVQLVVVFLAALVLMLAFFAFTRLGPGWAAFGSSSAPEPASAVGQPTAPADIPAAAPRVQPGQPQPGGTRMPHAELGPGYGDPQVRRNGPGGRAVGAGLAAADYSTQCPVGNQCTTGALITGVTRNSPAGRAGLATGDRVVVVGLSGVRTAQDLRTQLRRAAGRGPTLVVWVRNGITRTVRLTVPPR